MRVTSALVLVLIAGIAAAQVSQAVLAEADIVFVGTVERTGPAAPDEVPEGTDAVTVMVDRVIAKPNAVVLKSGTLVTVAVNSAPAVYEPGTRATFYTAGWIYGDRVAVRELAHEPEAALAPASVARAAAELQDTEATVSAMRDAKLEVLVDAAEAVIVGRVVSVTAPTVALTEASGDHEPVSEHDPKWREATIEVETWLKGEQSAQRVAVRFPSSIDVVWYEVPKLKTGMHGTFMLHKDNVSGRANAVTAAGAERPTYALLKATDRVPATDAPRVRRMTRP